MGRKSTLAMTARVGLSRRVADVFYTNSPKKSNTYRCRCGKKRKKCATSYSNLLSHVLAAHLDHFDLPTHDTFSSQECVDNHFKTTKTFRVFGWLEYIIKGLLPFSYVQKPVIKKHIVHNTISLSTFLKYTRLPTEFVEKKIVVSPEKLSLIFDGWSSDGTHYFAAFASFLSTLQNGIRNATTAPIACGR